MTTNDERVFKQLDRIEERLDRIDVTLARNTASLEEHMRRTALLEQEVKPIKAHVAMVNGVFKFLGAISLILGIIAGAAKLLGSI